MDEILNLIESVSEGFPSYYCNASNNADVMANSVDPDQTAPLGAV